METSCFAQYSDADLVSLYQQQASPQIWGELYRRYYPKVYRYCLTFTHDRDEAFDLTQDIFLKAAEKLGKLRDAARFGHWLFRIAHNECTDRMSEKQRRPTTSTDSALYLVDLAEILADEAREKEDLLLKMDLLLAEVAPEAKALLLAKYCEGKSIQELQTQYGLTESAVKMRLHRAKGKIVSLLDKSAKRSA